MTQTQKGSRANNYNSRDKDLQWRYQNTLTFLSKHLPEKSRILDLGTRNLMSEELSDLGHTVTNTNPGQDLDDDYEVVKGDYDCVTAFEIFEHLVAPYNLLKDIAAPNLICSIPLRLWFAEAYWNKDDEWDRHYHEFEPRQFDMLLNKAGWQIKASKKWKPRLKLTGVRPLLRAMTDRYYIVHCTR